MNTKTVEFTQMTFINGKFVEKTDIIPFTQFSKDLPDYVEELVIRGTTGDAIAQGVYFHARLFTNRP
ncbi:MAG: hypothetical protein GYA24_05220 [Candidatus Lokiarchaeota archaeon]|nr:hypothetical protein [Candidatus Lokiarchaeota archaeon]